jgi:hypothetical protein
MKRTLAALATLMLLATGATHAAPRCADFLDYADDTPMPARFKINGFKFKDHAGGASPQIQVGLDAVATPFHGVVYDRRGLEVTPPKPAMTVRLRLLTRSGAPLRIVGYDAGGGVQADGLCTNENLSEEYTFHASNAPITRLMLTGGADQGLVDQVCTLD